MAAVDKTIVIDEYLPLRDAVLKALRQEILTGRLKPGERLLEIELSKSIGVSRTPVREALHRLEQEGLVVTSPRRGARVTSIDEKSLRDVLEVRLSLETLAISLACDRIDDDQKKRLSQCIEAVETAVKKNDTDVIANMDVEFHNAIVDASQNEKLKIIVANIQEQMYRYRFEYIKDPSSYKDISREHRIMYRAIMEKDKKRAVEAITDHIHSQEQAIIKRIRQEAANNA